MNCSEFLCTERGFMFDLPDGRKVSLCEGCAVKKGLSSLGTSHVDHVPVVTVESIEAERARLLPTDDSDWLPPATPFTGDPLMRSVRSVIGKQSYRSVKALADFLGLDRDAVVRAIEKGEELKGVKYEFITDEQFQASSPARLPAPPRRAAAPLPPPSAPAPAASAPPPPPPAPPAPRPSGPAPASPPPITIPPRVSAPLPTSPVRATVNGGRDPILLPDSVPQTVVSVIAALTGMAIGKKVMKLEGVEVSSAGMTLKIGSIELSAA